MTERGIELKGSKSSVYSKRLKNKSKGSDFRLKQKKAQTPE